MSCDKVTYPDKQTAQAVVNGMRRDKRNGKSKKKPKRAYLCKTCKGWHITSAHKHLHGTVPPTFKSLDRKQKNYSKLMIIDYSR